MFDDKVILITGAAGSIGKILCKTLSNYYNAKLILLDRNENELSLMKESYKLNSENLTFVLGDILDQKKLHYIFKKYQINYVIHCAAYKQLPLMEFNLYEVIKNNIEGLINVINCSIDLKVERFLFISSDKAVYPSSAMGMTKRAGELIIEYHNKQSNNIQFTSLRICNLLNSNGSIMPLFEKQLKLFGKIFVTDSNAKRFFIDKNHLSKIVLETLNYRGKSSLLMGEYNNELKIRDLAVSFLKKKGVKDFNTRIEYSGLREGEKLKEDLMYSYENKHVLRKDLIYEIKSNVIIEPKYLNDVMDFIKLNSPYKEVILKETLIKMLKRYIK